mgnify:CR=1 FL=1
MPDIAICPQIVVLKSTPDAELGVKLVEAKLQLAQFDIAPTPTL